MAEEIKQKITLEGGDAVAHLMDRLIALEVRLAQLTDQNASATRQATAATEKNTDAKRQQATATDRSADAQDRESKELRSAGQNAIQAERGWSMLTAAKTRMIGAMTGVVAGLVGASGVSAALRTVEQDLERTTQKSREFAEASLNLQYLNESFNPQERAFVGQAAIAAGRQPVEMIRAFAGLKSRFPGESQENVQALMMEVAQTARTTDAPLSDLTNSFATIYQFTGNAQQSQNILRESIIQAGSDNPAVLAPLMARFMGIGQAVGLQPGQSAGAVAAATGLGLSPEVSVTGLTNVALALQGKGTPEGAKILRKLGIKQGDDLFGTLEKLSGAGLKTGQLESIFGREGLPVASQLSDANQLADFLAKVAKVQEASTTSRDLTGEAIADQEAADPLTAANQRIKELEARIAMQQNQDVEALRFDQLRKEQETILRSQGAGPVWRTLDDYALRTAGLLQSNDLSETFVRRGQGSFLRGFASLVNTTDLGPEIDRTRRENAAGNTLINIINQQYNLNNEGESRLTRPSGGKVD